VDAQTQRHVSLHAAHCLVVAQAHLARLGRGTGEWDVLLDDGRELPFTADGLRPPVRLLRSDQRVLLHIVDGAVTALTLASLPLFA